MKMSSTSTTDSTKNVAMDQPMVTYSSVAATPKMASSPAPSTIPQIPWGFPYNIWSNPHLFNQAFPGLGMMQTIPGPVAPSPPGFQPIASSPITEPSTISKASTSTPADETTSSPLISEPSTSTISKASTSTPADETTSSPLISEPSTSTISKASTSTPADETTSSPLISEPSTSIISKATTSSATIAKPTTHDPIVDEETAVTRVSKSSSSSSSDELDEDEATFSVKNVIY
ncbi:endochitinase A-like [Nilaparvata lugens]|uniref:endochitinase A-like n=1 Tax=Nilaparvata lugens TaxID=108931 RepID=UPI00193D94DB|nr:endochitinase A-like [Nilaparvata lugens]